MGNKFFALIAVLAIMGCTPTKIAVEFGDSCSRGLFLETLKKNDIPFRIENRYIVYEGDDQQRFNEIYENHLERMNKARDEGRDLCPSEIQPSA